jgi:hypothetical protein
MFQIKNLAVRVVKISELSVLEKKQKLKYPKNIK